MPDDETSEVERELGAFWSAVRSMFGSNVAAAAAADWLEYFETTNQIPKANSAPYRTITIQAASRMVQRLFAELQPESALSSLYPRHQPEAMTQKFVSPEVIAFKAKGMETGA